MTIAPTHRLGAVFALLLGALVVLAGCATATPYQPLSAGQHASGGYSEVQLEPGRYTVAFAGNTLTSRERVEQYMLFRAAELTLRDGYDGFRIVDQTTECDREMITDRSPPYDRYYGNSLSRPSWRYYYDGRWTNWYPYFDDPFYDTRSVTRVIERYETHAEIEMLKAPLDDRKYAVFDARKLVSDMGPTIEYPKD